MCESLQWPLLNAAVWSRRTNRVRGEERRTVRLGCLRSLIGRWPSSDLHASRTLSHIVDLQRLKYPQANTDEEIIRLLTLVLERPSVGFESHRLPPEDHCGSEQPQRRRMAAASGRVRCSGRQSSTCFAQRIGPDALGSYGPCIGLHAAAAVFVLYHPVAQVQRASGTVH